MRRWLVLSTLATTAMVTLAFLVPLALLVREVAQERALTSARQSASSLAPVIALGDPESLALAVQTAAIAAPGPLSVHLPDGTALGAPGVTETGRDPRATRRAAVVPVADGVVVETPVIDRTGATSVVRVAVPEAALRQGVGASWGVLGALGVLLLGVALFVADRLGRALVRPAEDVVAAARRLADGDRSARAPLAGPPELEEVARALNTLADRIDGLVAGEREAAADLSHRLRTPMTALRLNVEAVPPSPARERVVQDLEDLDRAVDRLIRDARRPPVRVDRQADLREVVAERVAFWSLLAEEEGRTVDTRLPDEPAPIELSTDDAAATIDALLGNVFAHTRPGTGFRVALETTPDHTVLTIDDDGDGWPDSEVAVRGVSGGGSTGLGLDIVTRTAERHRGSLVLTGSPTGGARARLILPRS